MNLRAAWAKTVRPVLNKQERVNKELSILHLPPGPQPNIPLKELKYFICSLVGHLGFLLFIYFVEAEPDYIATCPGIH